MKLNKAIMAVATGITLFGSAITLPQNPTAETAQAATRSFARSWRGTWVAKGGNLTITAKTVKFYNFKGHVKSISKARKGGYRVRFTNKRDIYLRKVKQRVGQKIEVRFSPNGLAQPFFSTK